MIQCVETAIIAEMVASPPPRVRMLKEGVGAATN